MAIVKINQSGFTNNINMIPYNIKQRDLTNIIKDGSNYYIESGSCLECNGNTYAVEGNNFLIGENTNNYNYIGYDEINNIFFFSPLRGTYDYNKLGYYYNGSKILKWKISSSGDKIVLEDIIKTVDYSNYYISKTTQSLLCAESIKAAKGYNAIIYQASGGNAVRDTLKVFLQNTYRDNSEPLTEILCFGSIKIENPGRSETYFCASAVVRLSLDNVYIYTIEGLGWVPTTIDLSVISATTWYINLAFTGVS